MATVALHRPERGNGLTPAMVEELHGALDRLALEPEIRALILTGTGDTFSVGLDLQEGLDLPDEQGRIQAAYRFQQRLAGLTLKLRAIPQVVIAAVAGPAVGGGISLAAAADLRVCDRTARFGVAFVRIGLSGGDMGSSWLLPRIVGPAVAADLMLTGRVVDAEEALRIGLVSRLAEPGAAIAAARDLLGEVLRNSPWGVRMTKELLNAALDAPSLRNHLHLENRTQILLFGTEDFSESVTAFLEKRLPEHRDR